MISSSTPKSCTSDFNMPTKMSKSIKENVVLVTVYVEKPNRRVFSSTHHHHHRRHYHDIPHTSKQEVIRHRHGATGKGYDRRAELLSYSQCLRESAQAAASKALQPKPVSSNNQQTTKTIVTVRSTPRNARAPTCFGNWNTVIPGFCRSLATKGRKIRKRRQSTSIKMKAFMKTLEVQKKWGTISKVFSTLRKHR